MKHIIFPKLIIGLLILFITSSVFAGKVTYTQKFQGSEIVTTSQSGLSLTIEDEYYLDMLYNSNWVNAYANKSVTNRVRLKHSGSEMIYYSQAWSLEVEFNIKYWKYNTPTQSPFVVNGEKLSIYFHPSEGYVDEVVFPFEDAHKIEVEIVSVTPGGTSPLSLPLPDDIQLEVDIEVDRYFVLDVANVPGIDHSYDPVENKVNFFWDKTQGAEEYDLEWYFASDHAPQPAQPGAIANRDFTRVTLSDNSYSLNVPFHGGYLWYRIRGVGYHGSNFTQRLEGDWSNNSDNKILIDNIDPDRNWQYSVSFSEEGKAFEKISFIDGSMRRRQVSAYLNSEDVASIAETFYDYEGRAAIFTIPAPEKNRSKALHFYEDFTLVDEVDNTQEPSRQLEKKDYHRDANLGCTGLPDLTLRTEQGASNYYSSANPMKDYGFNAVIASAEKRPYSRLKYNRKGKSISIGGIGETFRLGGGHNIEGFETNPMPEKLDRLFGSEAGHPNHYKMNIVQDQNGQYMVSYSNLMGQIIASSIIGEAPGLNTINSFGVNTLNGTFNDFNQYSPTEEAWVMEHNFFVEQANTDYDFNYELTKSDFDYLCNSNNTNHPCVYDLIITIHDDCDQPVTDNNGVLFNPVVISANSYTTGVFTVQFPKVGVYKVSKRLSLNQANIDAQLEAFEASLEDCIGTQQAFIDDFLNNRMDLENCEDCGTFNQGNSQVCDPAQYAQSQCEVLYDILAEDMSPDGQYFDNAFAGNANAPEEDWMETHLWANSNTGAWNAARFVDDQGNLLYSWSEVRTHWQDDWARVSFPIDVNYAHYLNGTTPPSTISITAAEPDLGTATSLVQFHPEYCRYTTCVDLAPSTEFTLGLFAPLTYSEAQTAGFLPGTTNCALAIVGESTLLPNDPYFTSPVVGLNDEQTMLDYLTSGGGPTNLCLWDYAGTLAANVDEQWAIFRQFYVGKKLEIIEAQLGSHCTSFCDNSLPPDHIADDNGSTNALGTTCNNPGYIVGFALRDPDVISPLNTIVDLNSSTNSGNNAITFADPNSPYNFSNNTPCGPNLVDEGGFVTTANWIMNIFTTITPTPDETVELSSINNQFAVLSQQLPTALLPNTQYRFAYDVRAIRKACTPPFEHCFSDPVIDEYFVTLSNGIWNGNPNTTANSLELLHSNGFGINLTHNGAWTHIEITFTTPANPNFTHIHLSHRGTSTTSACFGQGSDCPGEWIEYDNVSLKATCPYPGDLNCLCLKLDLLYQFVELENPTLTDPQIKNEMADLLSLEYGFDVLADDIDIWMTNCSTSANTDPGTNPTPPTALLEDCLPEPPDCEDEVVGLTEFHAKWQYNQLVEDKKAEFLVAFKAHCLGLDGNNGLTEDFTVEYQDAEHHFTLFYYDQAGNMTRTVPPLGVNILDQNQITAVQNHRLNPGNSAYPFIKTDHKMVTTYEYNSFNLLVRQVDPDHKVTSALNTVATANMNNFQPKDAMFIDNLIGYSCGTDGTNGQVWKTTDGGLTWNLTATINEKMNSLFFLDASNGWVVGDLGKLYYTEDGGTTWCQPSQANPSSDNLNAIWLTNPQQGWAVGDNGVMLKLDISGANCTNPLQNAPTIIPTGTTNHLNALHFNHNGDGFIVGDNNTILAFNTNNTSATALVYSGAISANLQGVWLTSPTVGYAVGGTEIYCIAQTNGSWNVSASSPVSSGIINDIYFENSTNGYATGSPDIILSTNDCGLTWQAQNASGNTNYVAIAPSSNSTPQFIGSSLGNGIAFLTKEETYSTRIWYNSKGLIQATQNARQTSEGKFSYIKYDGQNRPIESGQTTTPLSEPTFADLDHADWPLNWMGQGTVTEEVTYTYYDYPMNNGIASQFGPEGQTNLRSSIASVLFADRSDGPYVAANHYSYDLLRNIKTFIQEVPQLDLLTYSTFKTEYEYDLISGNVHEIRYQPGKPDQFLHRYCYDKNGRRTHAFTSRDGHIWDQDAKYDYYLHGPLARTEIGEQKVQGQDYAYTNQGRLKAINSNMLDPGKDIGRDGQVSQTNSYDPNNHDLHDGFARDAYGFSIGFFDQDYTAIHDGGFLNDIAAFNGGVNAGNELFNGNIRHLAVALTNDQEVALSPQLTVYEYDQLQRVTGMSAFRGSTFANAINDGSYATNITYDANGNILSLNRNGNLANAGGLNMDQFNYVYLPGTNRLDHVNDNQSFNSNYSSDLDDQEVGNYDYDNLGSAVRDESEEIATINWNVGGKVTEIIRNGSSEKPDLEFEYTVFGQRRLKVVKPKESDGSLKTQESWIATHYIYDAAQNLMATYTEGFQEDKSQSKWFYNLKMNEAPIYGLQRLGLKTIDETICELEIQHGGHAQDGTIGIQLVIGKNPLVSPLDEVGFFQRELEQKAYELTNHLGNVMQTVADRKLAFSTNGTSVAYYKPDVLTYSDYYPFGMLMPERSGGSGYRYGFNGMENDLEVKGYGNSYTTTWRQFDPRIGRWLSIDPVDHPWESPYAGMNNNPVVLSDPEGNCTWCSGAIVGGLTEFLSILGDKLYSNGWNFWAAIDDLGWGDAWDIGVAAAAGAVKGTFDGGVTRFLEYINNPKNEKVIKFLLEKAFDGIVWFMQEYVDEDFSGDDFINFLVGIGLEKVVDYIDPLKRIGITPPTKQTLALSEQRLRNARRRYNRAVRNGSSTFEFIEAKFKLAEAQYYYDRTKKILYESTKKTAINQTAKAGNEYIFGTEPKEGVPAGPYNYDPTNIYQQQVDIILDPREVTKPQPVLVEDKKPSSSPPKPKTKNKTNEEVITF